nr:hypothetical protein [Paludibacterium denitrificans]
MNITNGPQGINLIDPIQLGGVGLGSTLQIAGLSFPSVYLYYYLFLGADRAGGDHGLAPATFAYWPCPGSAA